MGALLSEQMKVVTNCDGSSLSARVIQIRRVEAGASLGYGSTFSVDQNSDIAIVGLGYADGLPRSLSNKALRHQWKTFPR